MDPQAKDAVLQDAQSHVDQVREATKEEIAKTSTLIERYQQPGGDIVAQKLAAHFSERLDELHHLFPSPYFVRCDVLTSNGARQSFHFGKFAFIEESIFSWTSPAATLRFADIGPVEYASHDKKVWAGSLARKDQFMISGGKIVFMTSESADYERTLIYQEQLSRRKAGFVLPEIVARMERAQDDVIRADYRGSYLISGPAGSGKTTLAFHRIAYLLQSPDTASIFSQDNVITFVQDEGTRAYFSQLLPELGIHNVTVTTFAAWAFDRLRILDCRFVQRSNGVDEAVDSYEFLKLSALRNMDNDPLTDRGLDVDLHRKSLNVFDILRSIYASAFTNADLARFADQEVHRTFDRYDLAILLTIEQKHRGFTEEVEYFEQKKNFEVKRHKQTIPLKYGLIVVDEVQNYLPEQITLLRTCIDEKTQSMLYVGDLAQQIFLGTMRDWSDAGEDLAKNRRVVLDKVYRSTKQIMNYIQRLGFSVSTPEGLRDGVDVIEVTRATVEEELAWVVKNVAEHGSDVQIGILSFSEKTLQLFAEAFSTRSNIHVLAIHQAQGVEFDVVYFVDVNADFFANVCGEMGKSLAESRTKIQRDLVYVALTRAMDRLFVVGKDTLIDCLT